MKKEVPQLQQQREHEILKSKQCNSKVGYVKIRYWDRLD